MGTRSSTPWNMPVKSRSAGSRSGREAVARDPEVGEGLVVGAAAHEVRDHRNTRVVAAQRADHRVDEVSAERHLQPDVLVDDLDLDVSAHDPPDVGEGLLLGAGQGAHVDERLGAIRDHVVLVAGGESGGVRRRPQGGAEESGCRTRRRGEAVGVNGGGARHLAQACGHLPRGAREANGPLGATERRHGGRPAS